MVPERLSHLRQLRLVGAEEPAEKLTIRAFSSQTSVDLLVWWPRIRAGLMSIKERQGRRATWTPEHVRSAIVGGQAELWLVFTNTNDVPNNEHERLVGFAVTQQLNDPFIALTTGLFVWMAYRFHDEPGSGASVEEMDKVLTQVAKDRGYTYLQALTSRAGLGRRMKRHGWDTAMHIIQKDLY